MRTIIYMEDTNNNKNNVTHSPLLLLLFLFCSLATRNATQMVRAGLAVHKNSETDKVTKDEDTGKLTLHSKSGEAHGDFDVILMAIGEMSWVYSKFWKF